MASDLHAAARVSARAGGPDVTDLPAQADAGRRSGGGAPRSGRGSARQGRAARAHALRRRQLPVRAATRCRSIRTSTCVARRSRSSARLWTHGWDLWQARDPLLFHHWTAADIRRDNAEAYVARSAARARHGLGPQASDAAAALIDTARYGHGNARRVDDLWLVSGVDPRQGTVSEAAEQGRWNPKKNRIVLLASDAQHLVARVLAEAGDNVRMSLDGFFHRPAPTPPTR